MSESATADGADRVSGRRLVLGIYVGLVAFAGMMGYIVGVVVDDLRAVSLLGLIPIPPTPIGLAVYGAITIALLLGVFLFLVRHVAPEE